MQGSFTVTFDGTSCNSDIGSNAEAGTYEMTMENTSDFEAAAVIVTIQDGSTYEDLVTWVDEHPGMLDQPPMVDVPGLVVAAAGGAASALVTIPVGTNATVCLNVATEEEEVILAGSFSVE